MSWGRTDAGKEYGRPNSEEGIHVDGPLTLDDWRTVLQGVVEAMLEHAERSFEEKT